MSVSLAQLEAEVEAGWPAPYWPQDDPNVRTQRLPERCSHGHLLNEWSVRWKRRANGGMKYDCAPCNRLRVRSELWCGAPLTLAIATEPSVIMGWRRDVEAA